MKLIIPIAALLVLFLVLPACSEKKSPQGLIISPPSITNQSGSVQETPVPENSDDKDYDTQKYAEGRELFALAGTEEEAHSIADLYGIKFVDLQHGVATFHTDEDPSTVISRGKESGWPLLEINYYKHNN